MYGIVGGSLGFDDAKAAAPAKQGSYKWSLVEFEDQAVGVCVIHARPIVMNNPANAMAIP